jgi:uncharacterized protein (TIGR04222 family)
MDRLHSPLWEQIRDFRIDPPDAALTFAARLARENGWSLAFANRVVDEYKRFVFLTMVAGHEVTPSDEVDEAWHLHLTYTKSYWDGLCRDVLKRPLHHLPTKGGTAEHSRHVQQYERTLVTYAKWYGHAPPDDVWPPAEFRFAKNAKHVRVDRRSAWIITKPRWLRRWTNSGPVIVGAVAAPILVGIANPLDMEGPQFLAFYGVLCGIAILASIVLRQFLRSDAPADGRQLNPYEIACLSGGVPGVLRSCLATLVLEKRLHFILGKKISWFKTNVSPDVGEHEIERIMLGEATLQSGVTAANLLNAARPAAEQIQSSLQNRGLMDTRELHGGSLGFCCAAVSGARTWHHEVVHRAESRQTYFLSLHNPPRARGRHAVLIRADTASHASREGTTALSQRSTSAAKGDRGGGG